MTLSRLSRIPPTSLSCSTVVFFTLIDVVSSISIMYMVYAMVYKPYNCAKCIRLYARHTMYMVMEMKTKMNRYVRIAVSVGLGFGAMLGFVGLMAFISYNGGA